MNNSARFLPVLERAPRACSVASSALQPGRTDGRAAPARWRFQEHSAHHDHSFRTPGSSAAHQLRIQGCLVGDDGALRHAHEHAPGRHGSTPALDAHGLFSGGRTTGAGHALPTSAGLGGCRLALALAPAAISTTSGGRLLTAPQRLRPFRGGRAMEEGGFKAGDDALLSTPPTGKRGGGLARMESGLGLSPFRLPVGRSLQYDLAAWLDAAIVQLCQVPPRAQADCVLITLWWGPASAMQPGSHVGWKA
jgi:hypothetical protein